MIYIRVFLPSILAFVAFCMLLRFGFRKNGMIVAFFCSMPAYMLMQNKYNIVSAVNAMALVFVLVYAAALGISVYKKNRFGDDDEK